MKFLTNSINVENSINAVYVIKFKGNEVRYDDELMGDISKVIDLAYKYPGGTLYVRYNGKMQRAKIETQNTQQMRKQKVINRIFFMIGLGIFLFSVAFAVSSCSSTKKHTIATKSECVPC